MGSASEFGKDMGLIHEAVITARKAGWSSKEWAMLAHNPELAKQIGRILRNEAPLPGRPHIIDCDADPFVPYDWVVEEHQKGGQFNWSATSVLLHLNHSQQDDTCAAGVKFRGTKLRKALEGEPVLNANVLDYLLKNPSLIPEDWKKDETGKTRKIFFWGTIYRDPNGRYKQYVRFLYWRRYEWCWRGRWIARDWNSTHLAAIRVR